jgi:hypothetical protein
MRRFVAATGRIIAHRLLIPVVLALFLLVYIGIAFFTDEALAVMLPVVGRNPIALGLLALSALNALCLMVEELKHYCDVRRFAPGQPPAVDDSSCRESLAVSGRMDVVDTVRILTAEGYRVSVEEGTVVARCGMRLLVPRLLWRLALALLFSGVLLSLTTRRSLRLPVIEGEVLQAAGMAPRSVERINFEDAPGSWFLQHRLAIVVSGVDGQKKSYGIYPPGRIDGCFVYPRYLAIAPLLRISAPGPGGESEGYRLIMLYPPGREDEIALEGGYRLKLVILQREGMPDPVAAGRFDLHVKVFRGDLLLGEGELPFGSRIEAGGLSVALLGARRFVVTDLVRDNGVLCIWGACIAALLSVVIYLPVRVLWPRREMAFSNIGQGEMRAYCFAEGSRRRHESLFLDLMDKICRNR